MKAARDPEKRGRPRHPPAAQKADAAGPRSPHSLRVAAWLPGAILVALVLIAYRPVWNAGFIWDDDKYVTKNPLLTAPDGLKRIWFSLDSPSQYFPLTYTVFRWERSLWGLDPAGYHRVNVLLHALNALLLWRLLRRLDLPGAWPAAALFAVHPVQVETVAWIAERKNLLMLLFCLLASWAWVRFTEQRRRSRWWSYSLALFCYLLALFAKTVACTLPAALLLILWWKQRPVDRRRLLQVVPFLLLGVALGLVTVWWEQGHQSVRGKFEELGAIERGLIATRAVWFYLGKLIWPADLSFSYPRWTIDATDVAAYAWPLAGLAAAGAIWGGRRHWGRGVEVAALFYVATLSPLLGPFMLATFQYSFVADHYQYMACIGPLALAAAGIERTVQSVGKRARFPAVAVHGILLLVLVILTTRQAGTYVDQETLWRATIRRNPGSFLAYNNLGNLVYRRGQADEAIGYYERALELHPGAQVTAFNLANALLAKGRFDQAATWYRRALEAQPAAAYGLANALFAQRQVDEAIVYYRKALELQPTSPAIATSLGNALLERGEIDEALIHHARAFDLAPASGRLRSDLATTLVRKGRPDLAIPQYEAALGLEPSDVTTLVGLAWVLAASPDAALRDGDRAVELAQQADRLSGGGFPPALKILSAAYAEAGRFSEALATAQRALQHPEVEAGSPFAEAVRAQIRLFEARSPVRDPTLAGSDP